MRVSHGRLGTRVARSILTLVLPLAMSGAAHAATTVQNLTLFTTIDGKPISYNAAPFTGTDLNAVDIAFNAKVDGTLPPTQNFSAGYISFKLLDAGNVSLATASASFGVPSENCSPAHCYFSFETPLAMHIEDPALLALFSGTGPFKASIMVGGGGPGGSAGRVDGTITYTFGTTRTSPAPEPATWATMLAGFLGMGSALRRSRTRRLASG